MSAFVRARERASLYLSAYNVHRIHIWALPLPFCLSLSLSRHIWVCLSLRTTDSNIITLHICSMQIPVCMYLCVCVFIFGCHAWICAYFLCPYSSLVLFHGNRFNITSCHYAKRTHFEKKGRSKKNILHFFHKILWEGWELEDFFSLFRLFDSNMMTWYAYKLQHVNMMNIASKCR